MSKLNQLKCPSCGAVLELDFPNQLTITCPYCHQQVINNQLQNSTNEAGPRILVSNDVNVAMQVLVDRLVDDKNVPVNIFEKMSVTNTKLYYFPMYVFEGAFRAPWSAQIERHERRQRIGYDGKLEDYYVTLYDYPSGEVAGNFSCNAASYEDLEKFNLGFTDLDGISISPPSLPLLSQISVNDIVGQLPPAKSPDSVWRENGEARAVNIGVTEASNQAPGYLSNCSASCDLKKSWLIYIPIWIIDYKYGKKDYRFVYIAEQKDKFSAPSVKHQHIKIEDAKPTHEQQVVLDSYNKRNGILSKIRDLGCAGIAGIGFIGCCIFQRTVEKAYSSNYHYYLEHKGDPVNLLWISFGIGIAFIIVISVIKSWLKQKDGIDAIEDDVAHRTNLIREEASKIENAYFEEMYKKKRKAGFDFMKAKGFHNMEYEGNSDVEIVEEMTDNPSESLSRTKICQKCGKEIESNHAYCRFCGSPQ